MVQASPSYRVLRDDLREFAYDRNACLPARSSLSSCRACADACPVEALAVKDSGITGVSDACVRCGRCAASCPTGALVVSGFFGSAVEVAVEPATTDEPLAVDCWRVPYEESPRDALRVPCLGGLDSGTLAGLHARRGTAIRLLDRGWCGDCPAGGCADGPPVARALATTRRALRAVGVAERELPDIETRYLDESRSLPAIPTPLAEKRVDRRQFFRDAFGLAARMAEDMQPKPESSVDRQGIDGLSAWPRTRMIRALDAMGSDLPPVLAPAAVIDEEACRNHRVCAAICPTTALQAVDSDSGSGIDFDPAACIQCGICERACPEQAIRITSRDGVAGPVTRHRIRVCAQCQREFVASNDGLDVCPACWRDRAWFTDRASVSPDL